MADSVESQSRDVLLANIDAILKEMKEIETGHLAIAEDGFEPFPMPDVDQEKLTEWRECNRRLLHTLKRFIDVSQREAIEID